MGTKDEYVRKLHEALDRFSTEIDHLSEKGARAGEETKAGIEERLAEARVKRDEAKARLAELHAAGDSAWEDLKAGAELAWTALGSAIDSAKSRFK